MRPTSRLSRLALATAVALASTQAAASVRFAEAFDGNWFNPAQDGRGVSVDFIPNATRTGGTFFAATFIYDNAGNPFWITLQDTVSEFQFRSATVGIFRTAAGSWASPGAATNTRIGTATVTLNHCNEMVVALDMDASTGLADQTLTLQRVGAAADASACVWQQPFTACPSFATAAPAFGPRVCELPATITGDVTLTNNITWLLRGKVQVGRDTGRPVGQGVDTATRPNGVAATLRIQPGTLLVGTAAAGSFDHLAVNRGSQIFAEGSREAPIVLTTANELPGALSAPAPGQVGGFVIYGAGPSNCFPNCTAEWEPATPSPYGGDGSALSRTDNSGVVRFMQVRFAGFVFTAGRELNSFTFSGVGAGTTLEYLQAFRGQDDGLEWFGGNVNTRYAIVTCPGDDGFDWEEGFTGKLQFGVVDMRNCPGSNHGLELSNSATAPDSSPRSRGVFANVTVVGNSQSSSSDAMQLNSGTGGNFYNMLLVGSPRSCIQIAGAPTAAAAGDPALGLTGVLTGNNIRTFGCGTNTSQGTGVATGYTGNWFASQVGNEVLAANPLIANSGGLPNGPAPAGRFPPAGATLPALTDWFQPTDFVGAFRSNAAEDNWTTGWSRPFNP
ncbi:MAG: hypothetical protein KGZ52_07005 [Xanthomonadaceae bacterium]|nr:hypothetical protein [Xanthomonadaceae bacterium]